MSVTISPIDLVRRTRAYDGPEPQDWTQKIEVPLGKPDWAFSLAEIDRHPFKNLLDLLGAANFQEIVETQGYAHPKTEFDVYSGQDRLPLYYYTRDDDASDARKLVLVSMGEYQPGRYIAHIEGFWRVKNADI